MTSGPFSHFHPAWSPDGSKIVFSSDGDGHQGLFIVNADGTGEVQITNGESDLSPSWSPDGAKIVDDAKAQGSSAYLLFVINADGTGQLKLTQGDNDEYEAVFSPDGTRLAFTVQGGGNDIWLINSDGTNPVALTEAAGDNDHARWSPDGTKIVFTSTRDDGLHPQVYVMNADGTGQTALTADPMYHAFPS